MTRMLPALGTALLLSLAVRNAEAAAPPRPARVDLTVVGTCPAASAVNRALGPLLGESGTAKAGATARIADLGDRFTVEVAGQSAAYPEASRDCAERARLASVFIALTLSPPSIRPAPGAKPDEGSATAGPAGENPRGSGDRASAPSRTPTGATSRPSDERAPSAGGTTSAPAERSPSDARAESPATSPGAPAPRAEPAATPGRESTKDQPRPPIAEAAPASPPTNEADDPRLPGAGDSDHAVERGEPAHWWARLGLAGRLDGAVGGDSGAATTTVGGELRAALGHGRWGLAAGAGALAPTLVLLEGASARQQRFPGYLVARLRLRSLPGLEVAFDAGVAAVLFQLTGRDVVDAQSVLRADAGGRLSFECRLPALGAAGGWAPFVSVQAEYFPRTFRLLVDDLGTVGTTPHLWLGASLGISFAPL